MTSRNVQRYIALLMESRNQAHAYHLTTKSYAAHKALQAYYEAIVPLFDSYAEAYMGKYGRLGRVGLIRRRRAASKDPRLYFRTLAASIRRLKLPRNTALRSIQDDIMVLIRSTMYMLTLR
jgi:Family of unknown function (DUF5856)